MMRANAQRRKERGAACGRSCFRAGVPGGGGEMRRALELANRQPLLRIGSKRRWAFTAIRCCRNFMGDLRDWFRKRPTPAGDDSKAVLFFTCSVNYNAPEWARTRWRCSRRTASRSLVLNRIAAACRRLEVGDVGAGEEDGRQNVASLYRTCRRERRCWHRPDLLVYAAQGIRRIAGNAGGARGGRRHMDLCEYLFQLKQQGKFTEVRSTPGASHTTYRAICGPRISATARAI